MYRILANCNIFAVSEMVIVSQKWQSLNRFALIWENTVSNSICICFSYMISFLIDEMFLFIAIVDFRKK